MECVSLPWMSQSSSKWQLLQVSSRWSQTTQLRHPLLLLALSRNLGSCQVGSALVQTYSMCRTVTRMSHLPVAFSRFNSIMSSRKASRRFILRIACRTLTRCSTNIWLNRRSKDTLYVIVLQVIASSTSTLPTRHRQAYHLRRLVKPMLMLIRTRHWQ